MFVSSFPRFDKASQVVRESWNTRNSTSKSYKERQDGQGRAGWSLSIPRLARVGCSAPNERASPGQRGRRLAHARSEHAVCMGCKIVSPRYRVCTIPGIIFRDRTNYRRRRSDLRLFPSLRMFSAPPPACLVTLYCCLSW